MSSESKDRKGTNLRGYSRVQERVKNLRKTLSEIVTTGRRSGSG